MSRVLFAIACTSGVICSRAQEVRIPLNEGWTFCEVGKGEWYSAEVPGVVQTDLLRHGLIPDFYQGSNIDSVQWIENEDWIYKRTLFVADTLLRHAYLDLVFKGLDTFAEVYLNDSLIGKADNMFRTWEWPVGAALRIGENELKVIFRSPIKEGAKLREVYGIQLPHDNDPTGVSPYIRKAAYQFGWDFCPRLVTSGIWKEVELRGWSIGRIGEVVVEQSEQDNSVVLDVDVHAEGSTDEWEKARCGIAVQLWEPEAERPLAAKGEGFIPGVRFTVTDPKRWEPKGSGGQPMYRVRSELTCGNVVRSIHEMRIGIRTVELDTTKDAHGQAFAFKVNGRNVFMKGCNIVPPDLVPSRDADRKWVELVKHMSDAGMNMARVWAGGVYPPDAFFDACDTAGILVWQDWMFAQLPPAWPIISDEGLTRLRTKDSDPFVFTDYLDNALQEALQQAERLRGHPSLAIWCGNNELDVAWKNWGWQERYGIHGRDSISVAVGYRNMFDADSSYWAQSALLFLPLYTPTSPLSNWGNAEGLTKGDLHYWGVWHGDSTFSSFKNNVGRFVSEYGFQSYPDSALLAKYIHPDSLYLGSPAVARLQRSYKTDRPIWEAIERELGEARPTTLGGFIEASQRAQAKAYGMAIEAHLAAQPHCMGTLLWQLNDCWPGPSWSIFDFQGMPKPAYDVVRTVFNRKH